MSGTRSLPVRDGVGWSPELTLQYVDAEPPSAASCNSALIEVVLLADRLVGGTELMAPNRSGWEVSLLAGTDRVAVGGTLSVADLRPITAAERARLRVSFSEEAIDSMVYRRELALACAQVAREMGQSSAGGLRVAGWVQLGGAVVVAALVGLAVDWYCQNRSRADQATRIRQAGIAAASRDAAERLRVSAETGQPMTPPTPVEVAAADSIREAAQQAREAGIGQTIAETAASATSNLLKAAVLVTAVWVGSKVVG